MILYREKKERTVTPDNKPDVAATEGALRNSKNEPCGREKHFKLKMRVLLVLSHRHSSSVCFFFVSILSAAGTAGGVGQAQVVADDLPRSGEATRGGDPERAEGRQSSLQLTLSPSATSSCQRLCSERTPQPFYGVAAEGRSSPVPLEGGLSARPSAPQRVGRGPQRRDPPGSG